jgi:hypothetical protein
MWITLNPSRDERLYWGVSLPPIQLAGFYSVM